MLRAAAVLLGLLPAPQDPPVPPPATLVAEARLRPLTNPMKMNGCALVIVNPPPGAEDAARQVCGWVADRLGDPGGRADIWSF
jgi:23S rRNA (adenine2030-N6)-methyltransferase